MNGNEKVNELMEAIEAVSAINEIVDPMYSQLMDSVKKEMEDLPHDVTVKIQACIENVKHRTKEETLKLATEFYSENFSDEEMDEIIKYQLSPVAIRLRNLSPGLYQNGLALGKVIAEEEMEKIDKLIEAIE